MVETNEKWQVFGSKFDGLLWIDIYYNQDPLSIFNKLDRRQKTKLNEVDQHLFKYLTQENYEVPLDIFKKYIEE